MAKAPILLVRVAVPWHRSSIEVIERKEKPHRGAVGGDEVLQHKEFDVTSEVVEQCEKVAVSDQRLTEWAALAEVVPADAFEREIEPGSAIFLLNPRAPLIVCLPSIRFPGKIIMPPIV